MSQERRTEPRTARRAVVILSYGEARDHGGFEPAELVDTSPRGIGLRFGRAIAEGAEFLLKLKVLDRVTLLSYVVRNCRAEPDGQYRVGARLVEHVGLEADQPPDEVSRALASL